MAHAINVLFIIFTILEGFRVLALHQNCSTSELGKKCIYKCCPLGQYSNRKVCMNHSQVVDFSGVLVYDDKSRETGKNVQSAFTILDGKFVEDPKFKNASFNRNSVGFIPYVLENGDLQLKKPNAYYLNVKIANTNFCIDYAIARNGGLSKYPQFFVVDSEGPRAVVEQNTTYLSVARWTSCVFLLLLLLVYALLPELRNLGGLILMNYVSCLFMAFLFLAVLNFNGYSAESCVALTLFIYYFFLASFCWMSVMSYDIWWTFRGYAKARVIHRRGERFKLGMYCLYAYGVPLLMTIFLFIFMRVDMSSVPAFIIPYPKNSGCFLQGVPLLLYLYTPMLILIICNWLFYMMTAFNMWRLMRGTAMLDTAAAGSPAAHRTQRRRFMVYLKLSVVMGLSWLFEIISFVFPVFGLWRISDTYNMLIGLLIFIIFVCKKKIYKKLYKRVAVSKTSRFYVGSSKSYTHSSSESNTENMSLRVSGNPKGQNIYTSTVQSL